MTKADLKKGQKVYVDNYVNEFTVLKAKQYKVELEYFGEVSNKTHKIEVRYDRVKLYENL